jgi:hypothetical protein
VEEILSPRAGRKAWAEMDFDEAVEVTPDMLRRLLNVHECVDEVARSCAVTFLQGAKVTLTALANAAPIKDAPVEEDHNVYPLDDPDDQEIRAMSWDKCICDGYEDDGQDHPSW